MDRIPKDLYHIPRGLFCHSKFQNFSWNSHQMLAKGFAFLRLPLLGWRKAILQQLDQQGSIFVKKQLKFHIKCKYLVHNTLAHPQIHTVHRRPPSSLSLFPLLRFKLSHANEIIITTLAHTHTFGHRKWLPINKHGTFLPVVTQLLFDEEVWNSPCAISPTQIDPM